MLNRWAFSLQAGIAQVAPANTGTPVITGNTTIGSILTLTSQGVFSGNPAPTLTNQWRVNGADIGGQTGSTFNTTGRVAGNSVTCRVTATNSAGSAFADSNAIVLTSLQPVRPVFVAGDSIAHAGTSWTKPAAATTGRLLVAGRQSNSGGVQGVGDDFTSIGQEGSGARDINFGWRIIEAGDSSFIMPINGNGITYSIWEVDTFDPIDPCPTASWASSVQGSHIDLTLPALDATDGIGIYGTACGFANYADNIGGASMNSQKTDFTIFTIEFRKPDGWGAEVITDPGGNPGETMTLYAFEIKPLMA